MAQLIYLFIALGLLVVFTSLTYSLSSTSSKGSKEVREVK